HHSGATIALRCGGNRFKCCLALLLLKQQCDRHAFLQKSVRARKRAPGYRQKATAALKRAREQFFGSQGAASPVRKIDPKTGEVIATAKPDVAGVF
ncbi:MAG: hypothetical protein WBW59_16465, partial [Pseudolabrys sp.]